MKDSQLLIIIKKLINIKYEGEYWDYKEEYPSNKADLVHDIICMSNNLSNNDGYIIIGVNDSAEIVGMKDDVHHYSQENIISILKTKKFASNIRPEISIKKLMADKKNIEVITIKNTTHTPYYLLDNFRDGGRIVRANHIYTRVMDTNTPIDKTADINHIEFLWKKRFGIEQSLWNRYLYLLDNYSDWIFDWGNKNYAYNKISPEFQLKYEKIKDCWYPCAAFYANPSMSFSKLKLYYHTTIMFETEIWMLDGLRLFLPKASNSNLEKIKKWYHYYDLSTVEGKLLKIFTKGSLDYTSRESDNNQFCIFNNEQERLNFEDYVLNNKDKINMDSLRAKMSHYINVDKREGGLVFSAEHIVFIGEMHKMWKIKSHAIQKNRK